MKKIKVLITDPLEKEGTDIFRQEGFDVDEKGKLSPEALSGIVGAYDVVVVRSGTKITKEVVEKAENLKIIGRAGVGLDNIDLDAATHAGVIVMNAPEGNTVSAAEHTVAMMMALARNIPEANSSLKNGQWEKKKFTGMELYNKTLGIVGLGRIGRRVASMAHGLGIKVVGYDPLIDKSSAAGQGITLLNLPGIFRESDFITFHIPLNESTSHIIGDREFELMKDGVRIINCARGGIVDEEALYRNIVSGKVKGAAIDVFEKEPPANSPLLTLKEVIVTPHLAASTKEAQINVAQQLARQIVEALTKKVVLNAVNLPYLDEKSMVKLNPYLSLGSKIGSLIQQLSDGDIKKVVITYSGDIINYDLTLLRANIIVGFLRDSNSVNQVNASLILKERGVELKEIRLETGGEFTNLITVEVHNCRKISVAGTIIRESEPRIVKIDGFEVEAVPEGYLLICHNEDKPGIMGYIGTVLGENNVNIASMTLGRKKKGSPALTVLNLDQGIDQTVVKQIEEFPVMHSVKLVRI
ncbi:MAG TPA: phosphoglycerate dehydrogenase [bacterium]|nr:phosphoglycerate dehydrogenase [bacterium]